MADMISLEQFRNTLEGIESSLLESANRLDANIASARNTKLTSWLLSVNPRSSDQLFEAISKGLEGPDPAAALKEIDSELYNLRHQMGDHVSEHTRILKDLRATVASEIELLKSGKVDGLSTERMTSAVKAMRSGVAQIRTKATQAVASFRNVIDQRLADITELKKARIDLANELAAHVPPGRADAIVRQIIDTPDITHATLAIVDNQDAINVVEKIRTNIVAEPKLVEALNTAIETSTQTVNKAVAAAKMAAVDTHLTEQVLAATAQSDHRVEAHRLNTEPTRVAAHQAFEAKQVARAAEAHNVKLTELGTKVKTFEAEYLKTNDTLVDLHKTRATQLKELAAIAPAEAKLLAAGQPVADVTGDAAKIIAQIEETQGKIAAQYNARSVLYTAIKGEATALEGAAAHLSEIETISQRASTTLTKSIEKFTGVRLEESIARAGKAGATAAANAAAEAQRAAAAKAAQLKGVTDTLGEKTKLRMNLFSEIQSEVNALTPEVKGAGVSKGLNNGLHLGTPKAAGSVQSYIDFLKAKNLPALEGVITKLTTLQGIVGEEATALKALSDVVGDAEAGKVLKGLETGIKDAAAAAEQIALKAKDLGKHLDDLVGQRIRVDEAQGAYVKAKIALDGTHKKVGAAFAKALAEVPADVQGAARDKQALEAILANDSNEYKQIKRLAKGKIELLITEAYRLISATDGESRILAQIADATQGKPQAQVNALLGEVDKLVAHTRSEHLSADKIAELRNGLKVADSFDTAHTKITGTNAAAASHIEEALAKLRGTADTLADGAKAAGKFGTKGWMVVGAAGIVGLVTAALAFGDKPRQTHADRIRNNAMDPNAMGPLPM